MIEGALRGSELGSQGVKLFGRREAFFPLRNHHLPFLEHMHELDADQRALGCLGGGHYHEHAGFYR